MTACDFLCDDIDAYPTETFQKVIDVNIKGTWHCLSAVLSYMRSRPSGEKNRRGNIIVTSSMAGVTGMADFGPYCASKWAILGYKKFACLSGKLWCLAWPMFARFLPNSET